ncbi:hypothetical protein HBI42_025310 [Parastagonospora nodorum]|nr:hypothetical protein HBI32_043150 [Parastagonospora nodorum]KAH6271420.1 hypothetical protein HBI42_025310 [Parastagonospora nodorum]
MPGFHSTYSGHDRTRGCRVLKLRGWPSRLWLYRLPSHRRRRKLRRVGGFAAPPKGGIIPSSPLKQGADEYLGHPSVLDFRNHDSGSDSELCAHLTAPQRLRISQARPTISPQCMSRPFDFEGQHLPSRLSCRCSSRNQIGTPRKPQCQ